MQVSLKIIYRKYNNKIDLFMNSVRLLELGEKYFFYNLFS